MSKQNRNIPQPNLLLQDLLQIFLDLLSLYQCRYFNHSFSKYVMSIAQLIMTKNG